jgi:hypothetical protein
MVAKPTLQSRLRASDRGGSRRGAAKAELPLEGLELLGRMLVPDLLEVRAPRRRVPLGSRLFG